MTSVDASDIATRAKEQSIAAYEIAKELGFFTHFNAYSMELFTPWTLLTENAAFMEAPSAKEKALVLAVQAKDEIISTVKLEKAVDPTRSFIKYNVMAFWLGVAESLIGAIFGAGLFSLVWNAGLSFAVAYTLYWTMTCVRQKKFMFYSLAFMLLYIAFNVYMGVCNMIFILPALLYFAKALCDVLMAINGYHLYKDVIGPDGSIMLEMA